jgi:hypothetical protein
LGHSVRGKAGGARIKRLFVTFAQHNYDEAKEISAHFFGFSPHKAEKQIQE